MLIAKLLRLSLNVKPLNHAAARAAHPYARKCGIFRRADQIRLDVFEHGIAAVQPVGVECRRRHFFTVSVVVIQEKAADEKIHQILNPKTAAVFRSGSIWVASFHSCSFALKSIGFP